jgi:hypothetical protein
MRIKSDVYSDKAKAHSERRLDILCYTFAALGATLALIVYLCSIM